jgi:hypothetical protein
MSSWAQALKDEFVREDVIPKGWKNVLQIAEELSVSQAHANRMAGRLVKSGKAEMRIFVAKCGMGNYSRKQAFYKLKD